MQFLNAALDAKFSHLSDAASSLAKFYIDREKSENEKTKEYLEKMSSNKF